MEKEELAESIERHNERILKEHPNLSREDLAHVIGQEVELLERLQAKLGKTKKQIRDWLSFMG